MTKLTSCPLRKALKHADAAPLFTKLGIARTLHAIAFGQWQISETPGNPSLGMLPASPLEGVDKPVPGVATSPPTTSPQATWKGEAWAASHFGSLQRGACGCLTQFCTQDGGHQHFICFNSARFDVLHEAGQPVFGLMDMRVSGSSEKILRIKFWPIVLGLLVLV